MLTYRDYIHEDSLPFLWCSGCGNGMIINALTHAFAELELPREDIVIVSGSGCFARVVAYPATCTIKMLHGRVPAGATGIKLANPKLHVFALMGDGDGITIGGNHLIHAARRNIDITCIMANNFNYGMTGGQYSGTTPLDRITTTSRCGNVEEGFDACELLKACGAPFVARTTAYDVVGLKNLIKEGFRKKGFTFIDVLSACPTHFGRLNKMGKAPDMIRKINSLTVPAAKAKNMSREELEGKYIVGKFVDIEKEDYYSRYMRMSEEARKK